MKFDAIYCINLKRRPDRKANAIKEFQKLGIHNKIIWWDAVDGTKLNIEQIPSHIIHPDMKKNLPASEIGCALSHIGVWMDILKNKYKCAIIFEDDIICVNDFHKTINNTWNYLPNKWDVLYLGHTDYKPWKSATINNYFIKPGYPLCTHAYCMKYESVKKILQYTLHCNSPIDNQLADNNDKLVLIAYKKNIFNQRDSSIIKLLSGNSDIAIDRFMRFYKYKIIWCIISILLIYIVYYLKYKR